MRRDQRAERVAEQEERQPLGARARDDGVDVVEVLVEAVAEAARAGRLAVAAQVEPAHAEAGGGERAPGLVVAADVLAVAVDDHARRRPRLPCGGPGALVKLRAVTRLEEAHVCLYITSGKP